MVPGIAGASIAGAWARPICEDREVRSAGQFQRDVAHDLLEPAHGREFFSRAPRDESGAVAAPAEGERQGLLVEPGKAREDGERDSRKRIDADVADRPSSKRMRLASKRGDFERSNDGSAEAA